jgi:2-oxoglutarate ferredoxin oxidoreductase subunit gamma
MRIRFAGAGGQGIVLCGLTFGKAAMLDGKQAIQTQAYGSASRGGLTKSDVGIDSEPIYDLVCDEVDALVALSQEAYDRYARDLLPGGLLFFEADLVAVTGAEGDRAHGIAATDIAFKEFGRKIMANMIMMGFVNERLAAVIPSRRPRRWPRRWRCSSPGWGG